MVNLINKNEKIFLAGSTGMVGGALKRALHNHGYGDEYKGGELLHPTRNNLDLEEFSQVERWFAENKPSVVIIAAAKVGGIHANNQLRAEFLLENLKINTNLLEACIPFPEIQIINLGSSCIYPLEATNPIKEESFMEGKLEPTNSPYAMAKLTAIEMGRSLNLQFGHKVTNLMPTNLYGPNDYFDEDYSHVIPGLISRMHNAKKEGRESFKIWGSGKPLREFLYVDDLASAIKFIIENDVESDLINIAEL